MLLILAAITAAAASAGDSSVSTPIFAPLAVLDGLDRQEISGLARSALDPGRLWMVNDSGNAATLHGIDLDGAARADVAVSNAHNLDWEDLAAYQQDGRSWLLLADIGDNLSWRSHLSLYRLPEPSPSTREVRAVEEIRFRYEDGPRDCEALAVDLPNRRFLLMDKGRSPVGLYALAMDGPPQLRVARRLADLPPLVPARPQLVEPLDARWRGSPTAMDLSADGRRMLVLSYTHILLFERRADEDWPAVLQREPLRRARLPAVDGFEAAALSADGRRAWIINEGRPARLYQWLGMP